MESPCRILSVSCPFTRMVVTPLNSLCLLFCPGSTELCRWLLAADTSFLYLLAWISTIIALPFELISDLNLDHFYLSKWKSLQIFPQTSLPNISFSTTKAVVSGKCLVTRKHNCLRPWLKSTLHIPNLRGWRGYPTSRLSQSSGKSMPRKEENARFQLDLRKVKAMECN